MDPFLSLVLFIIVVGLVAWLCIFLLTYVGRLLSLAAPIFEIGRILIIVIAVIVIIRRAWPLLSSA
jgi:hypothetical protein